MMLLQQKVSGKFELKMFITGDGLMESIKRGLVIGIRKGVIWEMKSV